MVDTDGRRVIIPSILCCHVPTKVTQRFQLIRSYSRTPSIQRELHCCHDHRSAKVCNYGVVNKDLDTEAASS